MRICENGVLRDMTSEEIEEMEEARLRYEAEEKRWAEYKPLEQRIKELEDALDTLISGRTK